MKNVIELEDLKPIVERLEKIENVINEKKSGLESQYIGNQEFLRIMGISKRTAQSWRDEGIFPFSQIGGKIYYCKNDVVKTLEKFRNDGRE